MKRAGIHGVLLVLWSFFGLIIILTPLKDSVPLVNFMSVYAIVVAHAAAMEGKLAKDAARESRS